MGYRRLAGTIDAAAQSAQVAMGEVLNAAALTGTGPLSSVPVVDSRQRRDGVLSALRTLTGVIPDSEDRAGQNPEAYRKLDAALGTEGSRELRVYLREDSLTAILDGFVSELSRDGTGAATRLSGRSVAELKRLDRFLGIVAKVRAALPVVPPPGTLGAISDYENRLQLFAELFRETQRGFRLVEIAVPPFAVTQPAATQTELLGRQQLRALTGWRVDFDREVTALASIDATLITAGLLNAQVGLYVALFAADRAADLYALGAGETGAAGVEERLASRFAFDVVDLLRRNRAVLTNPILNPLLQRSEIKNLIQCNPLPTAAQAADVKAELDGTYDQAKAAAETLSPATQQYVLPTARP
jgi:hypothetical protein